MPSFHASVVPEQAPSVGALSPSGGTGSQQTFTFQASDPNGGEDISTLQLLFAGSTGGSSYACYLKIDRRAQQVSLRDDFDSTWGLSVGIGQPSAVLNNDQCSLNAGGSQIAWSGLNLTINLPITFTTAYAGSHNITEELLDSTNFHVGPTTVGTWTVPSAIIIAGQVGDNLAGVPGVVVNLSGDQMGTITTDSGGNYSFTVAYGGSYTVSPVQQGYTFLPSSQSFTNVTSSANANFTIATGTEPGAPGPEPSVDPTPVPTPPGDVSASTTDCNDISGTWDSDDGSTFSLSQTGTAVTGSETNTDPLCGTVRWEITGTSSGGGLFTLTASNGFPPVDDCGHTVVSGSANVQITACSSADVTPLGPPPQSTERAAPAAATTTWTRSSVPLGIRLTANLYNNSVTAVLTGQNKTGTLSVGISGASSLTLGQVNQAPAGTYNFSLQRLNLTPGQYGTVTATWDSSSLQLPVAFKVIGGTRFSTYNTPVESACSGTSTPVQIFENNPGVCFFYAGTLDSQFIDQVHVNGTGISTNYGVLAPWANTWLARSCPVPALPGVTASNTFVHISNIVGACNSRLSGGVSLATNPNPKSGGAWACSDNVLLVNPSTGQNNSIRVVQDFCSGCSGGFNGQNAHIDAYSSAAACQPGTLTDYGNFFTIRLR